MAALMKHARILPLFRSVNRSVRHLSVALNQKGTYYQPVYHHKLPVSWNVIRCSSGLAQIDETSLPDTSAAESSDSRNFQRALNNSRIFQQAAYFHENQLRIEKTFVQSLMKNAEARQFKLPSQDIFLMIQCVGTTFVASPQEKLEILENMWAKFLEYGVPLTAQIYNSYLGCHLEVQSFSPVEILKQMQENDVVPNRITYKRFIEAYCLRGDIQAATQVLDYMKSENMPVGPDVFHSFIKGHLINNDKANAESVFDTMTAMQFDVMGDTYSVYICGLADLKQTEDIETFFKKCADKEVFFSAKNLSNMIVSLSKNGILSYNSELFDQLKDRYIQQSLHVATISELLRHGMDELAFDYYMVKKITSLYIYVDALFQNNYSLEKINHYVEKVTDKPSMLTVAEVAFNNDAFEQGFKALQLATEKIPGHCYYPVLKHFCRTKDKENLMKLVPIFFKLEEMNSLLPSYVIMRHVIPTLLEMGESVESMRELFKDAGTSEEVFNTMYCSSTSYIGNIDEAYTFASENKLDADTCHELLNSLLGVPEILDYDGMTKMIKILEKQSGADLQQVVGLRVLSKLIKYGQSDWEAASKFLDTKPFTIPVNLYQMVSNRIEYKSVPGHIKQKIEGLLSKDDRSFNFDTSEMHNVRRCVDSLSKKDLDETMAAWDDIQQSNAGMNLEKLLMDVILLNIEKGFPEAGVNLLKTYNFKWFKKFNSELFTFKVRPILQKILSNHPEMFEVVLESMKECGFGEVLDSKIITNLIDIMNSDDCLANLKTKMENNLPSDVPLFEVMCKYLSAGDNEKTQTVLDMTAEVYGEKVAFSHLVTSLICTGHAEKAIKILHTPNLRILNEVNGLMGNHSSIADMERFVNLTESFPNRHYIFLQLMRAHLRFSNPKKAIAVFEKFEEENLNVPSYVIKFAYKALRRRDEVLPESITSSQTYLDEMAKDQPTAMKIQTYQLPAEDIEKLRSLIQDADADEALILRDKYYESQLKDFYNAMFGISTPRVNRVFESRYFQRLTDPKYSDDLKVLSSEHSNRQDHAVRTQFLSNLNSSNTEKITQYIDEIFKTNKRTSYFFTFNALEKLDKEHPESFQKVVDMFKKEYESGRPEFTRLALYYLYKNPEEGRQFLQTYPKSVSKANLNMQLRSRDPQFLQKVIDGSKGINQTVCSLAYSKKILYFIKLEDAETALQVYETSKKDDCLMSPSIKNALARNLQKHNHTIPFDLQEQVQSIDSSDSNDSSDSDTEKK